MTTADIDPAGILATAVATLAAPGQPGKSGDPKLDEFARRAGPDVAIGSGAAALKVYAIFAVDPDTRQVRVRVVDEAGRLIRMIPPKSVAEMIAAMSGYGG
jgi:hypothetical protein